MDNSYRYNPRYQAVDGLPNPQAVLDFTPIIVSNGSYPKNYLMYKGSWIKLNITPDDDLRVNKIGIGLNDSDELLYDVTLKDEGNFSHTGYSEGNYKFDGKGFYIDFDNTYADKSYLVVDNMVVRSTLSVYDFLVMQKRFSAGSLAVSPGGGKVSAVNGTTITFEDPSALGMCSFAANDILITKRVAPDKTTVLRSVEAIVSSVSGNSVVVAYTTGTFQLGDEVVCVGNTTNVNRQGLIYMSADDADAPFLDVDSGVNSLAAWSSTNKVQVRLGNLAGYTSATFGALTGYGIFIKDNLYIEKGYIALGTGGYMRSGKTSYLDTAAGFWIGNDGGTPKINIGDSSNSLKWNGTTLSITGGIAGNKTYRSASTSPPATPATNDLWFQTDTGKLLQYNGTTWDEAVDATTTILTSGVIINSGGITLGTSSYLRSGKTSYTDNTAGWYLGLYSGSPVVYFGTTTNYFKWTGAAIDIKGSVILTNTTTFANGEKLGLDDVADGSSYARVLSTDIQAGHIKLIEAVGTLDDISDGTGYGKIAITDIQSGHIKLITAIGTLDDIDDGTSYQRVASTDLSAGHITVVASTASININNTTYGTKGIQLQYNVGNPRVYIGDGVNQYLKYDGTNIAWKGTNSELTAAGAFTASNATITGTVNANAGTFINTITMGNAGTDGYIQSYGWNGTANGFQLKGGATPSFTMIGGTWTSGTIQTAAPGSTRVVMNGTSANLEFYYGANSTGFIYASESAVLTLNAAKVRVSSDFYAGSINLGSNAITGGVTGTGQFQVNSDGQITRVNNLAASSYDDYVLASNGTSYTPRTIASILGATPITSVTLESTGYTYYVATSSGGSPTKSVGAYALKVNGTTIDYVLRVTP